LKIVEQPPETSKLDPANPTMKCRTFVKKSVAASVMTFLFVACDKGRPDIGDQGHRSEERQSGSGSIEGSGQDPRKKVDSDSESAKGTNVADNVQIEEEISDLLGSRQLSKENLTRLRSLLLQMADSDPEKLLEWCHRKYPQIDTMGFADEVMRKVIGKLGEEKFYTWAVSQNGESMIMRVAWSEFLGHPVSEDRAAETVRRLAGCKNEMLLGVFFGFLALADANLAISALDSSDLPSKLKAMALGGIVSTLSGTDPARAFSLFMDRKVAIDSGYLPGIAGMWVQKDPEAAFEALGKLNSNELTLLFEAPLTRNFILQEKYVRDAIRLFDGAVLTGSLAKQHERVMLALAGVSTKDALNELSGMAESPYRSSLVRDVFSTIAGAGDMDQAMAEADKLGDQDRAQALRGVVAKISEEHYEKALELASHAAMAAQQDLYREIARTLAYQNPLDAVRILEDPTFPEKIGTDFRQEMLNATVTTWAKMDLSAAQQWVEKLPETDAAKGYQGLMITWMKTDPVAASGWLSSQPLGPAREAGARVLISQIKDTDPEMAEQWRKTLPQEK
jgi:hypothetical protein